MFDDWIDSDSGAGSGKVAEVSALESENGDNSGKDSGAPSVAGFQSVDCCEPHCADNAGNSAMSSTSGAFWENCFCGAPALALDTLDDAAKITLDGARAASRREYVCISSGPNSTAVPQPYDPLPPFFAGWFAEEVAMREHRSLSTTGAKGMMTEMMSTTKRDPAQQQFELETAA